MEAEKYLNKKFFIFLFFLFFYFFYFFIFFFCGIIIIFWTLLNPKSIMCQGKWDRFPLVREYGLTGSVTWLFIFQGSIYCPIVFLPLTVLSWPLLFHLFSIDLHFLYHNCSMNYVYPLSCPFVQLFVSACLFFVLVFSFVIKCGSLPSIQ